ncbi:RNA polymerase sigma factor [Pelagibius marinus]|uniref:RNA polymerase sigma factor n=1 Tax=Pelagibius marinus TaxID=2762760 RepID=UPI001872B894|nr:RNA polymerase sigma factor [Pelagibius marinus]
MEPASERSAAAPAKPAAQAGRGDADAILLAAARQGDAGAFEAIMRRHNRLLFRTARAILQNDADAEEAVQEAYLKAFLNLAGFAGSARLSTWLVKITVNEALARLRRRMPATPLESGAEPATEASTIMDPTMADSPEAKAAQGEIRRLLEAAIDDLPQAQRAVFVLRAVEEFSTEDTAACLGIPADTVKTRLHRARRQLRRRLQRGVAGALADTFPFAGARCDRIVARVLARLAQAPPDG